eukprot:364239-Chlamydomonas_euryale.AAC.3
MAYGSVPVVSRAKGQQGERGARGKGQQGEEAHGERGAWGKGRTGKGATGGKGVHGERGDDEASDACAPYSCASPCKAGRNVHAEPFLWEGGGGTADGKARAKSDHRAATAMARQHTLHTPHTRPHTFDTGPTPNTPPTPHTQPT